MKNILLILCTAVFLLTAISYAQTQTAKELTAEAEKMFTLSMTRKDITQAEEDVAKGVEFLKKAADTGDAQAQFTLAALYHSERIPPPANEMDLYDLYLKAARQGHQDATIGFCSVFLEIGKSLDEQDKKVILSNLEAMDLKGNVDAKAMLALMYFAFKDMDKYNRYFLELKTLADNGNKEAQSSIGSMYLDTSRLNLPRDIKNGLKYLGLASDNGFTWAQARLGQLYFEGQLVDKDIDKALKYYELAAASGNTEYEMYVGALYYELGRSEDDFKKAFQWLSKAAEKNDRRSQFYLGQMYKFGKGVPKDDKKAEELLEQSALP